MGVFTTAGLFSIVRDAGNPGLHLLRALVPALPPPVPSHPGSDYPHRIL